jgi:hypothetical protein
MSEGSETNIVKIVVGGVITFVGVCFLSVSIWLATTVNSLAKSSAKLEITIVNLSTQTEKLAKKVDKISEAQSMHSVDAYRITSLEAEIVTLKARVKELESK